MAIARNLASAGPRFSNPWTDGLEGTTTWPIDGEQYLTRDDDPEDRRSKRIHLTERGHAAGRTIRKIVREVEADWEKQLGKKRFAQLRELLLALQPDRAEPRTG